MSSMFSFPYYYLDIPTVSDISGYFEYKYFTTGESVYPSFNDSTIEEDILSRYGYPRKIIIELSDSLDDLYEGKYDNDNISEILTNDNLEKLSLETKVQVNNHSRITVNIDEQFLEKIYMNQEYSSSNDIYEMALKLSNSKDENSRKKMSFVLDKAKENIKRINPTTNLPVEDFNEYKASQKTSMIINNSVIGDIVSEISNDGLSPSSDDFYEIETKVEEMQINARNNKKNGQINIEDYYMGVDILDKEYIKDIDIIPIAYIVFKTRVDGDERIVEEPLIMFGRKKKTIEDINIIYGSEYEYSVHTLVIVGALDSVGDISNFLLISKDSKKLCIECEEKNPPKPPSDIRFRFFKSSMLLEWDLPIETNKEGIPINDIKYVQIFRRSSINRPYELIRMYDFNDSMIEYPLSENIPSELVKKTIRNDNSVELILPERNEYYIYSMATVDAHGNSSLLGPQYAIYLDSLNQPNIEHIAYPGSLKQYPNLTIVEDIFSDSLKISGYNKLELFHNPDYTVLINGDKEQNLINKTKNNPSYVLQLIDIDIQKEQKIDIFMQ